VEAIRHAQAAGDWEMAVRLLAGHWPGLLLDGQAGTAHELLAGFPARVAAADAELAALVAADELARGSLEAAERYLGLAERGSASVPADRRGQFQVLLGVARLVHARKRGNPQAVAEEARRLQAAAEAPEAAQLGLGEETRATALINLGSAELWAARLEAAERHLEQGVALARRIGRPFLEFTGLAHQAAVEQFRSSLARAAERARQAVELAERHGWTDDPAAGTAYLILGDALAWQRPEEAEPWVLRAERTITAEAEPAAALGAHHIRGVLELARGRDADALAAFRAAERLAGQLTAPHLFAMSNRALLVHVLLRLGETERAEQALAGLAEEDHERGEVRTALAALRLAQGDPHAAAAVLAPVLDGSAPVDHPVWSVPVNHPVWPAQAFMLEAITRDELGEPAAADRALERALDLTERDGALLVFVLFPAPGLLERHARHPTAHAALLADIRSLLADQTPAPPARPQPLHEPLSGSEMRILRYLPTHLSLPEIANELHVSHNTVRTHVSHLYTKLGTHRRTDTVTRARALGLLAPSPPTGRATLPAPPAVR
jgi:LuxR family transcriptional regulator, maltose regulon positive regulatory protein